MSTQHKDTLGFVGIGRMGAPMVSRLLQAGYDLAIYDTNPQATAALAAQGARVAASPREVANAARLVLMSLPTPQIVTEVGLGADGLVHGAAVKTVIDLSTSGPHAAEQLAEGLRARGIAVIDCPVSGGVAGAERGTLSLMVAGAAEHYQAVQPVLELLGRPMYVGDRPGMAQAMKVINNLVSVTALAITSETLVMGVKAGLDPDTIVQVINAGSGRSNASEDKIPKYVLSRKFDFGFALGLSAKDVRLCLEESERLGVPLRVGDAVRQLLNAARDKFGEQADMTEIIRYIEADTGVQVRGKAAGPA
ncbi:NAD(P)-dependent oxidoreductase [Bordetella petrii]|uniref:Beta-hydroxyacid dehydrogenase n=1 Tax=Bordetella petrii (strain ATCC BAA-461 / DSM 12804 / CCUG 43448 / CIP 107267 / Se-1111R) TaxID=340100 RepID=A9IGS2_BORPD|nr:NAD(P)-dependent oxidoreductase [Bordetella petrii]CAP41985.1 putative beta-hydroxyacid dehydrogenase [Bordetella petrii]